MKTVCSALISFAFVLLSMIIVEAEPRSGFHDMSLELQARQNDETANPAFLSVLAGEKRFKEEGCATCHTSLKGVSVTFPKNNRTLEGQVNFCRSERLSKPAFTLESSDLLNLTAFITNQSRDMIIASRTKNLQGEAIFLQKRGQLNLSCADCHVNNDQKKLFSAIIPQGHSNGYPLYRLEWQATGSLTRRIQNCTTGVRATTLSTNELYDLEDYLMFRGTGLKSEAPALRP